MTIGFARPKHSIVRILDTHDRIFFFSFIFIYVFIQVYIGRARLIENDDDDRSNRISFINDSDVPR